MAEEKESTGDDTAETAVEEKSTACRMDDESAEECVDRKVPELIDEGMEQDQAVAVAHSVCETECSEEESVDEEQPRAATPAVAQVWEANGTSNIAPVILSVASSKQDAGLVEAVSSLIEQQAEQTRATRQLVDALSDLIQRVHAAPLGGVQGDDSAHESDVATPDAEDRTEDVDELVESVVRGFAERVRRDLSNNNRIRN